MHRALTPTDYLTRCAEVVLREDFDDTAVLFHPLTCEALCLNPVGVAIWNALDGRRTLAEVAASVAAQCDDAPPTVLSDTVSFVTQLYLGLFAVPLPQAEAP